jgi:hypothetical protein
MEAHCSHRRRWPLIRIGNFAPVGVSQQLTLAMTLRLRSRDIGLRLGVTCD